MHCTGIYKSPLGTILITQEEDAIVSLVFSEVSDNEGFTATSLLQRCYAWLDDYFAGKQPDPASIPISLSGSAFQQQVWRILQQIPYGQSITYGQIAKQIDPKMSAQAVGGAVGRNPVSIIVPCHRVLGAGGRLTGYEFGLDIKRALLDLDGIPYKK